MLFVLFGVLVLPGAPIVFVVFASLCFVCVVVVVAAAVDVVVAGGVGVFRRVC